MYHLFAYNRYYPNGGMNDYEGGFDTIEQAKKKANSISLDDYFQIAGYEDGDWVEAAKLSKVLQGEWAENGEVIEWLEVE